MTECDQYCLGTEEGHGHLTITRPAFVRYVARVREPGYRIYTVVGRSRSRRKAYQLLADAMTTGKYKRGDVLGIEGRESYYDPTVLVRMER